MSELKCVSVGRAMVDRVPGGPFAAGGRRMRALLSGVASLAVCATLVAGCVSPAVSARERQAQSAPSEQPVVHYRTVNVRGLELFYREAGPADAPAVLLLHGFPASSFMYRELIERLAVRYHVIAPDYPGFGYSAAPSASTFEYTFDALADVIDDLTSALDLERYAIYMQDFGGPVGFRLAARHPERVTALIVQNANAYVEGLPDEFWTPARAMWKDPSAANMAAIRSAAMSDEALEWNYTHGVADRSRICPDSWELQRALINRPGNKDIMLALLYDYRRNLDLYPQWQAYFREHQPPTLIVWGKHDVIFPPSGAHPYRRDLPRAELHLLDTGHFALEECVDPTARIMLEFMERHVAQLSATARERTAAVERGVNKPN
jgi:pimeloyl-ACP methyl ester carboxylesterase